jgi:leader peptidase (prepilin peptidase)/N-methyltransferase
VSLLHELPAAAVVGYVAAVGLIVGSYLNVVIHRLPLGLSTVRPRSRCPRCGAAIRATDNLPVLSWLLLRGRCRDCRAPISWRYPAVEATASTLFVASFARFGLHLETLSAIALSCLLVTLAAIDIDHLYLPDRLTLGGIAAGVALQVASDTGSLARALQGAFVGGGVLLVVAGAWLLATGREGMGLGDAKMLAMIGAFLGWPGVAVTLVVASATGAAAGVALLAGRRIDLQARLPFGLFLALGGLAALFLGPGLVARYEALL